MRRRIGSGSLLVVALACVAAGARADAPADSRAAAAIDSLLAAQRFVAADSAARALVAALEARHAPDSLIAFALDQRVRAVLGSGTWNEPESQAAAERAVRVKEAAFGPAHPQVAKSLINLGWVWFRAGEWERAKPPVERALGIDLKAGGERQRGVIRELHLLAGIAEEASEFALADSLYRRELAIDLALYGEESAEFANTLNSMSILLRKLGRPAEARPLIERAVAIREKRLGPDHLEVGWGYNSQANVYMELSEFDEARKLYERAIALWVRAVGPDHPAVGTGRLNLGNAFLFGGDTTAALASYRRALEIAEKSQGLDHPDVSLALLQFGQVSATRRDFAAARPALARALAIRRRAYGDDNPRTAAVHYGLGEMLLELGRPDSAIAEYTTGLASYERAGLAQDDQVLDMSASLARAQLAVGADSAAFATALRSESRLRARIANTASLLEERVALGYAGTRASALGVALTLAAPPPQATHPPAAAWDALARSRGQMLDEMAARHHAIATDAGPEFRVHADSLVAARTRLASLAMRGGDSPRARADLAAARLATERLEAALAAASSGFRAARTEAVATLDDAFRKLEPGDALVGFVRYQRRLTGNTTRDEYLAFVRRGDDDRVRVAPLGTTAALDATVRAWREQAGRPPSALARARDAAHCRAAGGQLRTRVWDPVAPLLASATRVFLVPDGALHLVDFAALPVGRDAYLVEGPRTLHVLSTERELAREPLAAPHRGLLAFGAPDFDRAGAAPPLAVRAAAEAGATTLFASAGPVAVGSGFRGLRSRCADFADLRFEPLPASAAEVDSAVALWSGTPGDARKLEGAFATEAALKSDAGGHRVLHLATHGFFLADDCNRSSAGVVRENPLLRCGLAFAGANRRGQAGEQEEDGILTGEEAGSLPLDGTEWVVLSACETAVGELRAAEGVFGLRRAFAVAGARTVIGSLWPVDDATSGRWMRALYRARLREGRSTADAVREADLALLRDRRARGLDTHPHGWAGFVAAGDWR